MKTLLKDMIRGFLKGGIIGFILGVTLAIISIFSSGAQTIEVDVGPEEKKCDQVVSIVEPSDIRTICWKDTDKIFAEDGVTVKFMLLPAGCVAVVQYKLKIELDVYQDKNCEILFYNKGGGYRIENEETEIGA